MMGDDKPFKKIKKQRELERITKELENISLFGNVVTKLNKPFGIIFFPKIGEYEHEINTNKKILLESIKSGNKYIFTNEDLSQKYLNALYTPIINMFNIDLVNTDSIKNAAKKIIEKNPLSLYTLITDSENKFSKELASELTKNNSLTIDLFRQYRTGLFDIETYKEGESLLTSRLRNRL